MMDESINSYGTLMRKKDEKRSVKFLNSNMKLPEESKIK